VNPEPRTLLIDADDTLWENNIYFERVTGEFVAALAKRGHSTPSVQKLLWQTERRNVKVTGYGSKAFCASLHEVARTLLGGGDLEPWIAEREDWICHHPIELMPGVRETLPLLFANSQTIMLTKGRPEEQTGKLERSGLAGFFHDVEIVFEKDVATYRNVVTKHRLNADTTWMVGNSPRSDINPAKAAGLRTVFIPYHTTWQHEIEEISSNGPETIVLESFGQLAKLYA
jgi:putative hydrolase of the HAD superfamily